ncbi:hypothetical protein COW36_24195 [bacterium (Candidatus Blackallbacteria) CG17_big_fil_post_rev_8_21_14_2_50_48_46]|uniref:Antitoxin n=1 Tax=bacterium (Candidatus Blackallbacteria) CG17_big_fil_post_rev_8_21_14_2_50_48_46 TaxID=2014261 RepID=A0A2M7FXG7_9BACT|nr:MAG: hypothetical protein COW64_19135 [bacterium (Candidatus Blackallbacteria) CG18_big_fil_WC_8_21_14_2_50_49_26]PIW13772.1 MAG: hypothetical protein COW36_24195 [bacterium (Candidatus Blackallbacteria) CG17_big_fil_post_rev_8_21_14_2_50_48_46]PIW44998.1 MAG: hypothetical protein COW20_21825 [bacterium (Candidatus Blackallbacteria) CG13_big_fil_rev_8_21_14_2_50_49_14]
MRHVISDSNFLNGKPYLGGIRLSLEMILNEFLQRKTIHEIVRKYPQLAEEDVLFALQYAIKTVNAHPEDADIQR